ncbi:MAG: glutamate 5-kinase [Cyclobacteriaceae bacterium]|nr:glutamate 5-kinase [Cyclobacteriaceae bacterium]
MELGRVKRIAIKIGSNVLTDSQGFLNTGRMDELVRQISGIRSSGIEVVVISSGAVASGKGLFQPRQKLDTVGQRQMWSSLGQVKLIQSYSSLFEKYQILCSQILVTRDDFRSREHYLNMKNCLTILLTNGIIPIINENDVVSVTELMFTDNDELAALVASMLNVDSLIILTSVDGIFQSSETGDQQLIKTVSPGEKEYEKYVFTGKSAFGKGGMLTKAHMASKAADAGIEVMIANGLRDNILIDLMEKRAPHTLFLPSLGKSNIKKWLSHAKGFEKGWVVINDGALTALRSRKASSLLPVGVVQVEGNFKKGDIITIFNMQKNQVGLGMSQYDDAQTREKLGKKNQRPLIHYDYLFLL